MTSGPAATATSGAESTSSARTAATAAAAAAAATAAESSELSMVLEKALVLLSDEEFSALGVLLDEYRAGDMDVEEFTASLASIISNGQKVGDWESVFISDLVVSPVHCSSVTNM